MDLPFYCCNVLTEWVGGGRGDFLFTPRGEGWVLLLVPRACSCGLMALRLFGGGYHFELKIPFGDRALACLLSSEGGP